MPPEQRNDEFSTEPWWLTAADRERVLTRFLAAELRTPEAINELRQRTGRSAKGGGGVRLPDGSIWVQGSDEMREMYAAEGEQVTVTVGWIPPSPERGVHVVGPELDMKINGRAQRGPCPVDEFVAFYENVQGVLHAAESQHANYLAARKHRPELALGGQAIFLSSLLQDVPLDLVYRRVHRGHAEWSVLAEPLRADYRSLSFAGELALAMLLRFIKAREFVSCPSCTEVEFFEDVRHREICSKPECRRWYRAKWERKNYAAEKAAKKEAKRGTARKR